MSAQHAHPIAERSFAGQVCDFLSRERRWVVSAGLLIAFWTGELFAVQHFTLVSPNAVGPRFAIWAPKFRFAMDAIVVASMVLTLRRRYLAVAAALAFVVHVALVTYFAFFQRSLSILTILNNWQEALELRQFATRLLPPGSVFLLLAALVVKIILLCGVPRPPLPRRPLFVAASVLACGYGVLFGLTIYLDPLDKILTTRGVGRLGIIRGYTGPWLAELYYLNNAQLLAAALDDRENVYDKLSPLESPIPIQRRLIVIQMESLDYNVLGYRVGEQEVTPFLNQLLHKSMFYRVRASHYVGSCDADFAVLCNAPPSPNIISYNIPGYPYDRALPRLLARHGYQSVAFHGNSGAFYNRRTAFEQMGFQRLNFQEELERDFHLPRGAWGIDDAEVLTTSRRMLEEASAPVCHFIITLTSHAPYTLLPPEKRELFPRPQSSLEHYFNSVRYLDSCLRDYLAGQQHVTVVLYGDHPTEQGMGTFQPDRGDQGECIPLFIWDSDRDLSQLQRTRNQSESRDGSFHLLDVTTYLRAQIERGDRKGLQPSSATVDSIP